MTDYLVENIKRYNLNFDIDRSKFDSFFEDVHLQKGGILLPLNSICRHYYFINKGAIKFQYLNDGEEITNWFAFENYFFTELDSYTYEKPSSYEIITLEDCEILRISKKGMAYLLHNHTFWQKFLTISQEEIIIKLIDVLKQFQTMSAGDRYQELFKHSDFLQRTKQKDLSSMIGITKHSLSRIRKKK